MIEIRRNLRIEHSFSLPIQLSIGSTSAGSILKRVNSQRHRVNLIWGSRTTPDADPGRHQVNIIESQKREHSRKPDELYNIIEQCSPGPYLELFARYNRRGWIQWGIEANEDIVNLPLFEINGQIP